MTTRRSSTATAAALAALATLAITAGCASSAATPRATAPQDVATLQLPDRSRRPQVATLADLLQGRVAGLSVDRTVGGGIALQVRGPGNMHGSEPLVVVDGDPLPGGAALSGILLSIPPSDVVRVRLVKDPSETAVYGSRGANGVLLITLRHAHQR